MISGLLYLLPVLVVVQIVYGYNRLTDPWQGAADIMGAFGNTGIFGGFVAMGFVTALGIVLSIERTFYRITLSILLIPLIIQLLCSQSRAAWIAIVAGMLFLLRPAFRKLAKPKVFILIPVMFIAGLWVSSKLYYLKKDSADGRLLIWTVSWNMLSEKPATGFGPNGFRKNYMLRQGQYFKNHPDSPWTDLAGDVISPFNEFLKIGVEQGFTGFLFVSGILYAAFSRRSRRKLNPDETNSIQLIESLLITLLVFSCFSYPFSYIQFQMMFLLCLAGLADIQPAKEYRVPEIVRKTAAGLAIAGCIALLYPLQNYSQAVGRWNRAVMILPRNKDPALEEFELLYPLLKQNALFLSVYGRIIFQSERYTESAVLLEKAMEMHASYYTILFLGESYVKIGEYEKAQTAFETASYMIPSSFWPHYDLAKLFMEQKDYRQAKMKVKEVLIKKIKNDNPKVDRMRREMQELLNDFSE